MHKLYDGIPALKDACPYRVGAAVALYQIQNPIYRSLIRTQFSSLTCENDMKPERLLDREATLALGDPEHAAVNFDACAPYLDFARESGVPVRAHTLVWHNQTPRWFFAEGFSDDPEAPLVSETVMRARLANYISDVMEGVNARWPGVVYAWDVVNEAIEPDNGHERGFRMRKSCWYQTMGEGFVEAAFTEARKHAAPGQLLFYNDYLTFLPEKHGFIMDMLRPLCEQGLVDGMGMQMHIHMEMPSASEFEEAARDFASLGLVIHLTELDVRGASASAADQDKLAARMREVSSSVLRLQSEGVNIASVTIWGLTDSHSWLSRRDEHSYPMLFDAAARPKPAAYAMIPGMDIPAAIDALESSNKGLSDNNPVIAQAFGADPWALVYDGRVYLYMTADAPEYDENGEMLTNTYGHIHTIRCISSDDLVNWTDHGEIMAAGEGGAAAWARNSWAPAAAWKTIDGQDRFFLYFADSGNGIGVLTADSPTGPFTDPIGGPLVSRRTPTCASVTWLFDPAVLVDEDGSAYLYVGGGVPSGCAQDPGTARVVRLGDDMVSLNGDPVAINPPFLFEDSGINRFGDAYVYSYCSNFNAHEYPGNAQHIVDGEIQIMVSDSPMGPFAYKRAVLHNPARYFGVGGNNHHCMFEFGGQWYIAYHAGTMNDKGYRSTHIDRLALDENGLPAMTEGTRTGVAQAKPVDGFAPISGATAANMAGATTVTMGGKTTLMSSVPRSWTKVAGVDTADGAAGLMICYRSPSAAKLSIVLDDLNAEPAAVVELPGAYGMRTVLLPFDAPITGTHDVYLVFSDGGVQVDWWHFCREGEVVCGDNPVTGLDFPDVDVIRVGDTYYAASTTMHMTPGCVLLESHDLINWTIAARVFDVLEDTPAHRLEAGSIYGQGMWAPSLRWQAGTFYLVFSANETKKTYLFRAADIRGPWQRSEISGFYYDPSLLLDDDGRAYIAHGNRQVRLTELKADLSAPKAGGLDRVIADFGEGGSLGYEGSHLYKIGGRYYLFLIHSLKERWRRVQTCLSADSLTGDFRGGVVLDDDLGTRPDGVAQGGIVDTPDGRWFAMLFQDTGAAGRMPVLLPMAWERRMPVLGLNGKAPRRVANLTTRPGEKPAPLYESDDFAGKLADAWEWNHVPDMTRVCVAEGLRITTGAVTSVPTQVRNVLTQRAPLPGCVAEVTADVSGMNPGDTAALMVLQSQWALIGLQKTEAGCRAVVITREENDAGEGVVRASVPVDGQALRLRAELRFSAAEDSVTFACAQRGEWLPLGGKHVLHYTLDHFMGARPALLAMSGEQAGGTAVFTHFAITCTEA